ncbi:MAG TPA: hypothetical protein VGQ55_09765, partial [Pyrinomonadaceae bacterium]|nr:hypothetical protein [Pyrinomonadaceae bacterium]
LLVAGREAVKRQLEIFRGREVSYDRNGILATFDGPARAIRCTASIVEAAEKMGVRVKAGLNTGECDVVDGNYSGIAVDLALHIANESNGDRILVSRTVKDLVAGSGLQFADAGVHAFESIEGEWRLFTVLK